MATHAPITGAPTRAPSIDRRKLLGSLALLPAAAVPFSVAASPRMDRVAWDRAMATYETALAAERRYDVTVYRPMADALERIAPRPDLWFQMPGESFRYIVRADRLGAFANHPLAGVREKAAAVEAAWSRHLDAQRSVNHDAINDEWERLDDRLHQATNALMLEPAPDRAAFWWKLDQLWGRGSGREPGEDGDGWCGAFIDALMADADRLLTGRAH